MSTHERQPLPTPAPATRFIPNRLLQHFEQISWPEPPSEMRGTPGSRQAALDLAAKMRGMWD